jgi:hypothetical protein
MYNPFEVNTSALLSFDKRLPPDFNRDKIDVYKDEGYETDEDLK